MSVEDDGQCVRVDELRDVPAAVRFLSLEPLIGTLPSLSLEGIDWVIVGGESGTGARPMEPDWVRAVRDLCQVDNVPFFFKQWGGHRAKAGGRTLDGQLWDEMPSGETDGLGETRPAVTRT